MRYCSCKQNPLTGGNTAHHPASSTDCNFRLVFGDRFKGRSKSFVVSPRNLDKTLGREGCLRDISCYHIIAVTWHNHTCIFAVYSSICVRCSVILRNIVVALYCCTRIFFWLFMYFVHASFTSLHLWMPTTCHRPTVVPQHAVVTVASKPAGEKLF